MSLGLHLPRLSRERQNGNEIFHHRKETSYKEKHQTVISVFWHCCNVEFVSSNLVDLVHPSNALQKTVCASIHGMAGDSSGLTPLCFAKCDLTASMLSFCLGMCGLSINCCFPCVAPNKRNEELSCLRHGRTSLRNSVAIVEIALSKAATCLEYGNSCEWRPNCFGKNLFPVVPILPQDHIA